MATDEIPDWLVVNFNDWVDYVDAIFESEGGEFDLAQKSANFAYLVTILGRADPVTEIEDFEAMRRKYTVERKTDRIIMSYECPLTGICVVEGDIDKESVPEEPEEDGFGWDDVIHDGKSAIMRIVGCRRVKYIAPAYPWIGLFIHTEGIDDETWSSQRKAVDRAIALKKRKEREEKKDGD